MQHERTVAERDSEKFERRAAVAHTVADELMNSDDRTYARQPRCYGIQVLIVGRRKCWRDRVSAQVRQAGYGTTTVDCAIDALTVLVLGLPVDVLVTDSDLRGDFRCARLAIEARALRPNLGIVLACDQDAKDEIGGHVPDALLVPPGAKDGIFAVSVRAALDARA